MCSSLGPPSDLDDAGGDFEVREPESEYVGEDFASGVWCNSEAGTLPEIAGTPGLPVSVSESLDCEYAISPWNIGMNVVANGSWSHSSQGPLDVNWGEDSGSPPIAGEVSELTNSTMVDDVQVSSGCVCPSELMGCSPGAVPFPALDELEHGFSQLTSNTSDVEGYNINFDPDHDDDDNFNLAELSTSTSTSTSSFESQTSRGPSRRGSGNSKGTRAGRRRIVVNPPCKIACHFCRRRKILCRQTTFPFPETCDQCVVRKQECTRDKFSHRGVGPKLRARKMGLDKDVN